MYCSGFKAYRSCQSSKCKCGPVVNSPEFPIIAIASPAFTFSPVVFNKFSIVLVYRNNVSIHAECKLHNRFPVSNPKKLLYHRVWQKFLNLGH